jgi:hypothetical protein
MSEYITFKKFITPTFIMIIYILGALVVTILSFLIMLGGAFTVQSFSMGGGIAILLGVLMLIFGNLFWRILCEYMIVQFRIYDELVSLNRKMGGPLPTATQMPPSTPTTPATPICPTCGGPLRYIQQYQRWYCDREQKYV